MIQSVYVEKKEEEESDKDQILKSIYSKITVFNSRLSLAFFFVEKKYLMNFKNKTLNNGTDFVIDIFDERNAKLKEKSKKQIF